MSVRNLTYAELAEIWGVSKDAARKKVEGLRLPRTRGKRRASACDDRLGRGHAYTQAFKAGDRGRRPGGVHGISYPEVVVLQARIADLQSDLSRERADRERDRDNLERERAERLQERDRADGLTSELSSMARELARIVEDAGMRERGLQDQLVNETAQAREERDRLAGEADAARRELAEWRAGSWWRRLAG